MRLRIIALFVVALEVFGSNSLLIKTNQHLSSVVGDRTENVVSRQTSISHGVSSADRNAFSRYLTVVRCGTELVDSSQRGVDHLSAFLDEGDVVVFRCDQYRAWVSTRLYRLVGL